MNPNTYSKIYIVEHIMVEYIYSRIHIVQLFQKYTLGMFLKTVILVLKHNEKNTYKGVASPRYSFGCYFEIMFFFTKTMNSEIGYHDPRLNNSRFCNAF